MSGTPVLSDRRLNRTLLARQLLLERGRRPALEVVEHLVGLQAQIPDNPYLGLWSRIADFDPGGIATDMLERRAVRMALMRSTLHLVSSGDALLLRPIIQPVLDREMFRNPTWSRGLEGVDLDPVLAFGRELVERRPMAFHEIRSAMAERFPGADAASLAFAVRNLLPTFQPPPRGVWGRVGQPKLTTLDAWTGAPLSTDPNPEPAILRYLAAFGPATVADMQAWSRLQGLREVVERLRPRLRTFRDERGRELFDVPDAPLGDPDSVAPVRFLPDYDNVLLSHQDRRRVIGVVSTAAIGRPSVLVDGLVAGLWRLDGRGEGRELVLEPLAPLGDDDRAEVEAEARALLAFLATAGPRRPAAKQLRWAA